MKILKPEKTWLLIGALCAVLGGATLAGCGGGGDDDDDDGQRNGVVRPGDDDDD